MSDDELIEPDHPIGEPFEKPDVHAKAFAFACRVVRFHRYLYRHDPSTRRLAEQLLRSGTAIGANLEEARAAQSRPDFLSKCNIALKEARETLFWLRLISACDIVAPARIVDLEAEADELVSVLTAIVKSTRLRNRR
jgi:four helix bundle protein